MFAEADSEEDEKIAKKSEIRARFQRFSNQGMAIFLYKKEENGKKNKGLGVMNSCSE